MEAVADIADQMGRTELAGHLRALLDARAFRRVFMRPGLPAKPDPSPNSHLGSGVREQLASMDLARPVPASRPRFVSRLKLVPKRGSDAHLWRVILATIHVNTASYDPPKAPIPNLRDLMVRVLRGAWCVTADLRSWFYQIAVNAEIAETIFAFRVRDSFFAFMRLVMGWRWSPYLATATAKLLWERGCTGHAVDSDVWVDDSIIIADSEAEASAAQGSVSRVLDDVGAVVKQWNPPRRQFLFVGIEFDTSAGTARMSDAFTEAFRELVASLVTPAPPLRAVWSAAGSAVWACYALRYPYAPFASLLADVAAAAEDPKRIDAPFDLDSIHLERLQAVTAFLDTKPVFRLAIPPSVVVPVAVDGSPVGIGVVVHRLVEVARPHGVPLTHRQQQRAEAVALCAGLDSVIRFAKPPPGSLIIIISDNLSCVYRMARWAAPPAHADAVCWLWRVAAHFGVTLKVGWIPGDRMPADAASRATAPHVVASREDLAALVSAAFFPDGAGSVVPCPLPFV